ncbi:MAG: sodium/solute symporter, partial [Xanthomonadales bacterium]|nr:sodium/solute symporter [Xanthomonadales bacterium]
FLAVSLTDFVQGCIMMLALVIMPIVILTTQGGAGVEQATERLTAVDPEYLSMFKGVTLLGWLSAVAWGLGYFGQPHIIVRFMAVRSVKDVPTARRIGMSWMILCLAGSVCTGFFGIAYFAGHADLAAQVSENPERVFIQLAAVLFNPWVAGVLLSAILAAVMSTLSCQLLVCSSALTEDFYRGFVRPKASHRELVWFGRTMVLAVAVIALWIARDPESRVLGLVAYAWAGFGAAFGPVVLLSLSWQRMTRNGALAGMIVGALVVVLWKQTGSALYEMVPGFIAASLAIIVVSLLGAAPANEIQARHEQVRAALRENPH